MELFYSLHTQTRSERKNGRPRPPRGLLPSPWADQLLQRVFPPGRSRRRRARPNHILRGVRAIIIIMMAERQIASDGFLTRLCYRRVSDDLLTFSRQERSHGRSTSG